jgi:hypothetical protein
MDHADRLLGRIHAEKIRPVPRWIVLARRLFRLGLFVLVLVLLSVSSALLFQELHEHRGPGWIARALFARLAPWVWSFTSVACIWGAWLLFRELPRAWRLRPWIVIVGIVSTGLASGFVLERVDGLVRVHRTLAHLVPAYRTVWQARALEAWHDPVAGRLAGRLDTQGFLAVDGRRWLLVWSDSSDLAPTGPVRLNGTVGHDSVFVVRDWKPAPGDGAGGPLRQGEHEGRKNRGW